jgi:hypothetical protein
MYEDIQTFVSTCTPCQKFEKLSLIVPLQPLQVRQMFQTWGVDIIGPINPATENGN